MDKKKLKEFMDTENMVAKLNLSLKNFGTKMEPKKESSGAI